MNIRQRKIADKLFFMITGFCMVFSVTILFAIIGTILTKGSSRLTLNFLFTESRGAGFEGGIYYQIMGTLLLMTTAAVIVTPFSCAIALLHYLFTQSKFLNRFVRIVLHILNSTPSIIFGILGFLFFVKWLGWEKSWLSGGIILAVMILPTVTIAFSERLKTVPKAYIEQAKALGLNENNLVWSILFPYGWGGLLTGLVLGLARAAGETAPIMLTAAVFSGARSPTGIKDNPVLALPYHIFNLAQDAYSSEAITSAWATAAVLTILVILMSAVAVPFRRRSHEEAKK